MKELTTKPKAPMEKNEKGSGDGKEEKGRRKKKKKASRRNLDRTNNSRTTLDNTVGNDQKDKEKKEKKKNKKNQDSCDLAVRGGSKEEHQALYFPTELLEPVIHTLPFPVALRLSLVSRAWRDAARRWGQPVNTSQAPLLCIHQGPEGNLPAAFLSTIVPGGSRDEDQGTGMWPHPPAAFQVKAAGPRMQVRPFISFIGSFQGWIFMSAAGGGYSAWNPVSGRVRDLPTHKFIRSNSSDGTDSDGQEEEEGPFRLHGGYLQILYVVPSLVPGEPGSVVVAVDRLSNDILVWEPEGIEYDYDIDAEDDVVKGWTVIGFIPGDTIQVACALDAGGRRLLALDDLGGAWEICIPPLHPSVSELGNLGWADAAELGGGIQFQCVPGPGAGTAYVVAFEHLHSNTEAEIVFVKRLSADEGQGLVWTPAEGLLGGAIFIDSTNHATSLVVSAEHAGCRPDSVYRWGGRWKDGAVLDVKWKRVVDHFTFSHFIEEKGKGPFRRATWLTPSLC